LVCIFRNEPGKTGEKDAVEMVGPGRNGLLSKIRQWIRRRENEEKYHRL
jgi:hypothetical protein